METIEVTENLGGATEHRPPRLGPIPITTKCGKPQSERKHNPISPVSTTYRACGYSRDPAARAVEEGKAGAARGEFWFWFWFWL
jgi:hypothetical protein